MSSGVFSGYIMRAFVYKISWSASQLVSRRNITLYIVNSFLVFLEVYSILKMFQIKVIDHSSHVLKHNFLEM